MGIKWWKISVVYITGIGDVLDILRGKSTQGDSTVKWQTVKGGTAY